MVVLPEVFLDKVRIHQVDAAHGFCRGPPEKIIDKVVDVIMQLEFQQSEVFFFQLPQIQFIDRLWAFRLRTERGTHSAKLLRKPEIPQVHYAVFDVPGEQQRQVPAAHPCLVQTVQKSVEIPQVQCLGKVVDAPVVVQRQVPWLSSETVEVPLIS